ncbi:protein aardvark [Anaeramoeba ignava]|uniref:Protein aardvark n=1 Tax=Anaeramoeba ignava TaxID=1746090 RepID=A0A9Q0LMS9_ANAIG|nr:protein aardvark [Anaeramoeba ignava]
MFESNIFNQNEKSKESISLNKKDYDKEIIEEMHNYWKKLTPKFQKLNENQNQIQPDFEIICESGKFCCHKLIVSRSSFLFKKILEGNNKIKLNYPKKLVKKIVQYLYYGKFKIKEYDFIHLFIIADELGLEKFKEKISYEMHKFITKENILDFWIEISSFKEHSLGQKINEILLRNLTLVPENKIGLLSLEKLISLLKLIDQRNNQEEINQNDEIFKDPGGFVLKKMVYIWMQINGPHLISLISRPPKTIINSLSNLQNKDIKYQVDEESNIVVSSQQKYESINEDERNNIKVIIEIMKENLQTENSKSNLDSYNLLNSLSSLSRFCTEGSKLKSYQKTIQEFDGISFVIESLEKFPDNSLLQSNGFDLLANLTIDNFEIQNQIRELKGIEIIINSLKYFPNEIEIQRNGILALSNLIIGNEKNQEIIQKEKGINIIIDSISRSKNIFPIAFSGIFALSNFSFEKPQNQKLIQQREIQIIIEILKKYKEKFSIQSNGFDLLANLTIDNFKIQNQIRKLKGIELIINSLKDFPNEIEIQRNGILALSNLIIGNEKNQEIIQKENIENIIFQVWKEFPDSEDLIENGFLLLKNSKLILKKEIFKESIPKIINLLSKWIENEVIQESGSNLLNRYLKIPEFRKLIKRKVDQILPIIINAKEKFPNSKKIKNFFNKMQNIKK